MRACLVCWMHDVRCSVWARRVIIMIFSAERDEFGDEIYGCYDCELTRWFMTIVSCTRSHHKCVCARVLETMRYVTCTKLNWKESEHTMHNGLAARPIGKWQTTMAVEHASNTMIRHGEKFLFWLVQRSMPQWKFDWKFIDETVTIEQLNRRQWRWQQPPTPFGLCRKKISSFKRYNSFCPTTSSVQCPVSVRPSEMKLLCARMRIERRHNQTISSHRSLLLLLLFVWDVRSIESTTVVVVDSPIHNHYVNGNDDDNVVAAFGTSITTRERKSLT